ncbi:MAG: FKBP-type peptidyl-prolyl cis-trans isomerase [Puniceicoccales bacterium]|jgi:FKBP-type peptidyl-prolyl cis-trans isomerase|nr:FKBP-type peptidyl-prolyl cis-trans isomerase [Puniceicoccales bacterium]
MYKTVFALALAALLPTPALTAAETAAPAPAPAAPAPVPLTAEQKVKTLEVFGWVIGRDLEGFGLTSEELDLVARGLRIGAEGKELSKDQQELFPLLRQLLAEKEQANRPKMEAKDKARLAEWVQKNADFLRERDKEQGVQQTPSGLRYKVLAAGAAPIPNINSVVKAKYTGKLVDGTVFDSSGDTAAEFPLGNVIAGWQEGLQKVGKGGKILLYIPADQAYGSAGQPPRIPPQSVLSFDVEIVDVLAAPTAPAVPPAPAPAAQ